MLCKIGQKFFECHQQMNARFSGEFSRIDDFEKRQKLIDEYLKSSHEFHAHVDHCLECNMDLREKQ